MKIVQTIEKTTYKCDRCGHGLQKSEVFKDIWYSGHTSVFCEKCYNSFPDWVKKYIQIVVSSSYEYKIDIKNADFNKGYWVIFDGRESDSGYLSFHETLEEAKKKALVIHDESDPGDSWFQDIIANGKPMNLEIKTGFDNLPKTLKESAKEVEQAFYATGSVPENEFLASHYRMILYSIATLKELTKVLDPKFCDPGYLDEKTRKLRNELELFGRLRCV